jgi:hypothetical protein
MENTIVWQHQAVIALDLARERAREAQAAAERDRLVREARAGRETGPRRASRRLRGLVAAPVRAFSDATQAVSDAACEAASRIEGRTA